MTLEAARPGVVRQDPALSDVARAAIGVGGLAMCLTLVFLGMRAVMDIGGACAEGGPYVPRQGCPDGAVPALLIGIFGLFLFGAIAALYGSKIGGIWAASPLFAWSGLFLSLGWNFLDYGVINPPAGETVVWGWLLCGVVFVVMGAAPLVLGLAAFGDAVVGGRAPSRRGPVPNTLAARPLEATQPDEGSAEADDAAREAQLRAIATDMGALVDEAAAASPVDPAARPTDAGTLVDRLDRLADMHAQGLLTAAEYETAKAAVMRELEGRP